MSWTIHGELALVPGWPGGPSFCRASQTVSRGRQPNSHHHVALSHRLPAIFNVRDYVEAGAVMSYGPNLPDQFRRAGDYVDKILRGTYPGNIPVKQPTKFDLIINLTTAKALRLTITDAFLSRADEVIE
jgi:ABC-type uncharacterized transport system substrate-binding protein